MSISKAFEKPMAAWVVAVSSFWVAVAMPDIDPRTASMASAMSPALAGIWRDMVRTLPVSLSSSAPVAPVWVAI